MNNNWHNIHWQDIVSDFGSDIKKGLSEEQVLDRQKEFGLNLLPEEKALSKIKIFLDQLKSPLIYILIIASFITLFLREWADFIVIFGAVFLNTLVGYFQENKASQALKALKKVVKVEAQVLREGNEVKLDSHDLVPGDIIVLTSGNKVPADARLIEANNLKVNEAPLTGEWLSSQKTIEILLADVPVADRDNMVYMGCTVEDGKGKAVVVSIGKETEMGKISFLVKETEEEKTPLQKRLAKLSKLIGIIVGFISLAIFIGGLLRQKDLLEMFMTAIAVAVAAIPEGLPIAMTVILSLGMQRILKRKGLVRKLIAAETLGSTSIIASDKTLTLTEGKMEVGEIVAKDKNLLLQIIALSNEAFVENPQDAYTLWRVRGRPTDKALLLAGAKDGFKKWELEKEYLKIDEIPFNSENKFVVTFYQRDNQGLLYVVGAPEKIFKLSKLNEEELLKLNNELEDLTNRGLRVIAVAYKKTSSLNIKKLEEEMNDLVFVGFVGLKDPLRKEAKEAFMTCKKAGMRTIIITGDHLLTARAIGKELGLKVEKENIIEGKDLDKMSDKEFQERVRDIEIYARVEPAHKLRIVEAWQKMGEVIAMTGDGINDAPALKKADIGIALGSGTDVAKEVSDLVLLTDNFNIIVAAVEEGRAIIDNIRKVITYLLSDSFTETILIGASIIFGWPLPVIAVQILWVNLIEDGLPSIALAFEKKEKDVLDRKPEGKNVHLLTKEMKVIIFIIGILTDFVLLGLFWWLFKENYDMSYIRTMIFAALGINSLFYVFSCKSLRRNIWHINIFSNKFLVASVLFGFLMLASGVHLPVFQTLLKTIPLGFQDWLIVLGLGLLNMVLIEAAKYYFIVRHETGK